MLNASSASNTEILLRRSSVAGPAGHGREPNGLKDCDSLSVCHGETRQ